MESKWNAKGDSTTSVIMWIGTIISVLIMVMWFTRTIYPTQLELENINYDLKEIQSNLNLACNSIYYKVELNPRTEHGNFSITNSTACISTLRVNRCKLLLCNTQIGKIFDLENLTKLVIQKNDSYHVSQK